MENLLSLLGNPHKQVSTVHIAGTKGKSGIFKSGVPILTVNQQPEAMNVLKTQAAAV